MSKRRAKQGPGGERKRSPCLPLLPAWETKTKARRRKRRTSLSLRSLPRRPTTPTRTPRRPTLQPARRIHRPNRRSRTPSSTSPAPSTTGPRGARRRRPPGAWPSSGAGPRRATRTTRRTRAMAWMQARRRRSNPASFRQRPTTTSSPARLLLPHEGTSCSSSSHRNRLSRHRRRFPVRWRWHHNGSLSPGRSSRFPFRLGCR
mmetsp:Transcript_105328/g.272703  ORF Transcript_105328/g.272703 Transcript_105328/m.272703 type:complete len:203 (+) Transcript_105328:156-764(+)